MKMKTRLLETILRVLNFDRAQLVEMRRVKTSNSRENARCLIKHIREVESVFKAVKSGKIANPKVIDEMWLCFNEELKLCQELSGKLDLPSKAKLFD